MKNKCKQIKDVSGHPYAALDDARGGEIYFIRAHKSSLPIYRMLRNIKFTLQRFFHLSYCKYNHAFKISNFAKRKKKKQFSSLYKFSQQNNEPMNSKTEENVIIYFSIFVICYLLKVVIVKFSNVISYFSIFLNDFLNWVDDWKQNRTDFAKTLNEKTSVIFFQFLLVVLFS